MRGFMVYLTSLILLKQSLGRYVDIHYFLFALTGKPKSWLVLIRPPVLQFADVNVN